MKASRLSDFNKTWADKMTTQLALRRFDITKTDEKRVILVLGKRNSGKCFQRGSRIMMWDGSIKTVETIEIGDRLMGDDSTPRNVLGLARGRDELFCIKPKHGAQHVVTGDHVLCLQYNRPAEPTIPDAEVTVNEFRALPRATQQQLLCYRVGPAPSKYAFEVIPVGEDDYYGFETDGNHRFLLDDFTVSHNSQMSADWLFHKRRIPVGILMSSTEEATGFFKSVCGIPDTYIYPEWNPEVIDTIIAKQRKLAKAGKLRNCFIVLDDLAFDKAIFNSKQMRELMFNGRHYGIMLIITAQFLGDLPTYFRSNVDYVITYRTPSIQDRDRLYKNFFGVVPTFGMFQAIMDSTTENYSALVLDNTVQSNALADCIQWYKAPLRGPAMGNFQIGCKAFHTFARRRGKKDDLLPEESPANPHRPTTAKNPRVLVKKLGAAPR